MAGVHRLQHVERFFAAHLADDDAVGAHTEGVDDELPLADRALAFDVGRPGFEPRHVLLVQLQLGGVLDGRRCARDREMKLDSTLSSVVLPAPVPPLMSAFSRALHAVRQEVEHRPRQRAERDQVVGLQPLGRENGESRAAGRRRPAAG